MDDFGTDRGGERRRQSFYFDFASSLCEPPSWVVSSSFYFEVRVLRSVGYSWVKRSAEQNPRAFFVF